MVNVLMNDAIDEFLTARQGAVTKNTLKLNRVALRSHALKSIGNIDMRELTQQHVDRCLINIQHLKPWTYNTYASSIRTFFTWCRRRSIVKLDFFPEVDGVKIPKTERNRVPVSDFPKLLDAAEQHHPRDRILVATGLYLLTRAGESTSLRLRDVSLETGSVNVTVQKTKETDVMPIDIGYEQELRRWLTWYGEHHGTPQPDWYLIPSTAQERIMRTGVDAEGRKVSSIEPITPDHPVVPRRALGNPAGAIQRALNRIGFPIVDEEGRTLREGGHTLRRSGARAFFDALAEREVGYDGAMRIVMARLHHSSQQTTELYLGLTADKLRLEKELRGKHMYPQLHTNVVQLPTTGANYGS